MSDLDEQRLCEIEVRMKHIELVPGRIDGVNWVDSDGDTRALIAEVRAQRAALTAEREAHQRTREERDAAIARAEQAEAAFDQFQRQVTDLAKACNEAYGSLALDVQELPAVIARLVTDRAAMTAERDSARARAERFRDCMYAIEESGANRYDLANTALATMTAERDAVRAYARHVARCRTCRTSWRACEEGAALRVAAFGEPGDEA